MLISNKISSGEKNYKYFIGYMFDYKMTPLRITLLKVSPRVKSYDGKTKWTYFLIKDGKLSKEYDDI